MDEKAQVKLLKTALLISATVNFIDLLVMFDQYKSVAFWYRTSKKNFEVARDAQRYIEKIIDVTQPTPEQRARILVDFDFEKWTEDLQNQPKQPFA